MECDNISQNNLVKHFLYILISNLFLCFSLMSKKWSYNYETRSPEKLFLINFKIYLRPSTLLLICDRPMLKLRIQVYCCSAKALCQIYGLLEIKHTSFFVSEQEVEHSWFAYEFKLRLKKFPDMPIYQNVNKLHGV